MMRFLTGIAVAGMVIVLLWLFLTTWGADYYIQKGLCGKLLIRNALHSMDYINSDVNSTIQHWRYWGGEPGTRGELIIEFEKERDRVSQVKVPLCLLGMKKHYLSAMGSLIASKKAEEEFAEREVIEQALDAAYEQFDMAEQETEEIRVCLPFCEGQIFNQLLAEPASEVKGLPGE